MSAKKFVTVLGFGFAIFGLDYYLYILWHYFFINNTCLSNNPVKDVNMDIICWGVNPTSFLVVLIVAVGATIGFIYQIYRTLRYGW
jgi:hypothetical protein